MVIKQTWTINNACLTHTKGKQMWSCSQYIHVGYKTEIKKDKINLIKAGIY